MSCDLRDFSPISGEPDKRWSANGKSRALLPLRKLSGCLSFRMHTQGLFSLIREAAVCVNITGVGSVPQDEASLPSNLKETTNRFLIETLLAVLKIEMNTKRG